MDLFKDLTKQTAKVLDNISSTFDEISSLATNSATAAGSMLIIKSKIENQKLKLKKLYQDLGEAVVNKPEDDYKDLTESIKSIQKQLDNLEDNYRSLKIKISENTKTIKDKVVQDLDTVTTLTKEDLEKEAQILKEKVETETEKIDKTLDSKIEEIENKIIKGKKEDKETVVVVSTEEKEN